MRFLAVAVVALCSAVPAGAEVKLASVFSDHAVVQRATPIHVWGFAAPGEAVTVEFDKQHVSATASALGQWELSLMPEKAGGPYTLRVSGSMTAKPQERVDILVGDVWLASGQSNMEMPLKGFNAAPIKDSEKEIAAANHPQIRLLVQRERAAASPMLNTDDVWKVCTPESAKDFSAAAYFFGRKIQQEENVPVGLIDTTWGGTPAQSWISTEGIAWAGLTSVAYDSGAIVRTQGMATAIAENLKAQDAAIRAAGGTPQTHPAFPNRQGAWNPGALFNAMVSPFVGYTLKGFLWYQGETDHEGIKALNYSRVFPALIEDWRKQWAQGDLPFLFVQIASYGDHVRKPGDTGFDGWGQVRDAQRRTLRLVNTGMAVALDVGLADNIHPPDKQTVGARLAQTALGMVYGRKLETASPMFTGVSYEGASIRAWFTHADGLSTHDASLGDFDVAGSDGKFVAATAKIEVVDGKATVVASAPTVTAPKYIRYGWTPFVQSYVYNSGGLPLGTFTSESDAVMIAR